MADAPFRLAPLATHPRERGWASKHSGGKPFSQNLASHRLTGGGGPRSGGRGHLKMVNGELKMVNEGGALWKHWGAILYSRPLPARWRSLPTPKRGWASKRSGGVAFSPFFARGKCTPSAAYGGVFHLKVKRLTTFCASLTLLQNVFAVQPEGQILAALYFVMLISPKSERRVDFPLRVEVPRSGDRGAFPSGAAWPACFPFVETLQRVSTKGKVGP